MASQEQQAPTHGKLGLFDAVSIIIGIVIGSSIYVTPVLINKFLSSPYESIGVWVVGGVLCLIGALCYAELATAYPKMGGDYAYLTKSYGPWFGFMFGWAQITVILTASIGMMGFVFGEYAVQLLGIEKDQAILMTVLLAIAAIAGLTAVNILGVVLGKTVQNILSLVKVVGLGAIIYVGFSYGGPADAWNPDPSPFGGTSQFAVPLILILYAYGGWNDAAFVASDMRNRRHIPATLILGTAGVMIIYVLVNFAYIQSLGFSNIHKMGSSPPIAAQVMKEVREYPDLATKGISVLVMISALGAINGLLFTGSRVSSALGKDHSLFAALGKFSPRFGSPVLSLMILAGISVAMVLGVGTKVGRDLIDAGLAQAGVGSYTLEISDDFAKEQSTKGVSSEALAKLKELKGKKYPSADALLEAVQASVPAADLEKLREPIAEERNGPMPWKQYDGGFFTLFAGTAPVFWLFFLLAGLSVFVLREMDKETERPFKVPLYPYLPTIFCIMCIFGLFSSQNYAKLVSLIGWLPLVIALPLYLVSRYTPVIIGAPEAEKPPEEPAPPEPERPPWMAAAEPASDAVTSAPPADGDGIKPPEDKVPSPEG